MSCGSGDWKFQVQGTDRVGVWWGPTSSQTASFFLCPHMEEILGAHLGLFHEDINPIHEGSSLVT